ncbi:Copia protein, partial [Mucuna pruriens]
MPEEKEDQGQAHQIQGPIALEAGTPKIDAILQLVGPTKLYCKKKSAINIAYNSKQHDRTKYIQIDRHFIKEKLEGGQMCMSYVPLQQQLVDVLTKGLNSLGFNDLIAKLGTEDIYFSA